MEGVEDDFLRLVWQRLQVPFHFRSIDQDSQAQYPVVLKVDALGYEHFEIPGNVILFYPTGNQIFTVGVLGCSV